MPKPASRMLVRALTGLLLLAWLPAVAQYCTSDARFTELAVFAAAEIDSSANVLYGVATDAQGVEQNLVMDFFYPALAVDTLPNRPFILLCHGGGFVSGNKEMLHPTCVDLAQRGYVVASMSYRLGTVNGVGVTYRAQQDAAAAMRYAVSEASTYRIDTAWMFVGGSSAGAVNTLGLMYMDQADWAIIGPTLQTTLGGLQESGNALTNSYSIKGHFNNWGSTPGYAVEVEEMLPMISFHGALDTTVPIDTAPLGALGSRALHQELVANNVCSDLTVDEQGGHGIYLGPNGTEFRAGKASCFFKSVFCSTCATVSVTDSVPALCSQSTFVAQRLLGAGVRVFPNPSTGQFSVELPDVEGLCRLQLLDVAGRVVLQEQVQGNATVVLRLPDATRGLYLLRIESDRVQHTHRVVVR